jgi:hypothetical protein
MNGIPIIDWNEDFKNFLEKNSAKTKNNSIQSNTDAHKRNLMNWNMDANLQLQGLENNLGEVLISSSTQRMDIPNSKGDNGINGSYADFFEDDSLAPIKLTQLKSSSFTLETLSSQGFSPETSPKRDLRQRLGLPQKIDTPNKNQTKKNIIPDTRKVDFTKSTNQNDSHSHISPRIDDQQREGIEEISSEDVECFLEILDPPDLLHVTVASILLILSNGIPVSFFHRYIY